MDPALCLKNSLLKIIIDNGMIVEDNRRNKGGDRYGAVGCRRSQGSNGSMGEAG